MPRLNYRHIHQYNSSLLAARHIVHARLLVLVLLLYPVG